MNWSDLGRVSKIRTHSNRTQGPSVLHVTTCSLETATLMKRSARRIAIYQKEIESTILGISLRDRVGNEEIRRKTKVTDVVEQIARNK